MPEDNSTPTETSPTVSLTVVATEQRLLAEWLAIKAPEGYSEENLYYTVELFRDKIGIKVTSIHGQPKAQFDGIDFNGEHVFRVTVQGILSKGDKRVNCGPLQFGEVKVTRVTGVFANTLDDNNSGLLLIVRWDETESDQTVTYSVRVAGRNSKLDANPAKNITVNLASFSNQQSGIVAGEKYTVYVRVSSAESAENVAPESEGFEFIAGEDPDTEEDEYDAHFNANSGTAGDPINMATGSFSYQHIDLQIAGTPSFVFQTFYFSPDAVKSKYPYGKDDPDPDTLQVLGNGWSHTYMTFLKAKNNEISVYWGTGGKSRYKAKASSFDGTHYSMKGVYDGSKLFYKAGEYILTTHAQQQYVFDQSGRLLHILSIEGNMIRLVYPKDQLHKDRLQKVVKVTSADDEKNDYFELAYTEDGRLKSVTDNFKRKIQYAVKNKNLESYTDPTGRSRLFAYYDKSLMKTAKDQNGDVFVYNEYKDEKVVFQQDANAYALALRDTDRYGLSIQYSKTKKAMTAAVTDNMKKSITYISDSRGNLLSQETILSESTVSYRSFAYDGFNNVIQETEYEGNRVRPNEGKVTRHSYDGNLNRLESHFESPDGKIIYTGKFRYNRSNQKVADTDHLGNTTVYRFNTNHELVRLDFPLGQTETYEYENGIVKGLVKKFTDRLGNSFHFTYERDLLISALDPYGQTTRFSDYIYGLPRDHKILDQKILLKTTLNAYNLMGEKLSESVLYGKQPAEKAFKTEFTLDALGQVKEMKNPGGYTTHYTYNPNMKLVKITFPAVNGVTSGLSLKYDRNDNVVQTNSGEGVTEERFSYDALNRCIRRTDGNGNSYEFKYWMDSAAGKPFTTTQRTVFPPLKGGNIFYETIVSDIFGRPVEGIGRDGQVTRNVYDALAGGRLKVRTLDPPAVSGDPKTQYKLFDELGRLIESTDREGNKTLTAYAFAKSGPNNTYVSVVTETDPLKIETILHLNSNEQVLFRRMGQEEGSYSYDALGRLTASDQRIRNDERVRVAHAYSFDDGFGCLKAETAAGNAILSASYFNGVNQLVKQKNGLGTITERRFNEKGELSELLIIGEGKKINYTYDKAGRNTRVNFADQSYLTNTYDKSGNCLETTQFNAKGIETSKQTRSFDAWNRQESLKDLKGWQAGYQYNATDQLTRLAYPALPGETGVVAVDYTYDNLQRMVKVSDWKKRVTEYAYSPDGLLLKATFSNWVVSDYSFDKAQRLTGLKTSREGMIILSNRWELDGNGNPIKSKSLLPLAPAPEKGSTQFNYNLGNQLTEAGGVKITYDVNGNPVSLPEAGNLRFNDLNLMTQCGSDEYAYDARGLRASSKINGKLRYYWTSPNAYQAPYLSMLNPSESEIPGRETGIAANGSMPTGPQLDPLDQVLQLTDESHKREKRFVYGLGLIAEENAAGDYLVYHFDERGSTVAMSDKQGDIVNRFAYSIYGGLANHYGERSTPFLYNGQQGVLTDANNLYSMRSRFYQPGNMRFLQQDFLLGDPFSSQSLNRYAYVGGNPVRYVDPLGLERESGKGGGPTWLKWFLLGLGAGMIAGSMWRIRRLEGALELANAPVIRDAIWAKIRKTGIAGWLGVAFALMGAYQSFRDREVTW